jgi:PKD repeat protein
MNRHIVYLVLGVVLTTALVGLCSAGVFCPFGNSGDASAVDPFQVTDSSGTGASCVFGSSGNAGTVDPFQVFDPAGTGVPCPFGNSGDAGAADPSQITDQAATVVPCPFPQSSITSGEASSSALCGGESSPAPSDPNGDGSYEDLNGNGRLDFNDVILYFQNMAWIRENEPVGCFDYNANGNVDFADLILLFHEIG